MVNSSSPTTPTICLNMIVKNESKIILRLLQSVLPIIDSYVICDTGSTDDTPDIIHNFFSNTSIPGRIYREPFRDFGYNRTFSLKMCENLPKGSADYILLLDADMVLRLPFSGDEEDKIAEFKCSLLQADAHYVFQGSDTFYYKNVRFVRNYMDIVYWGVTHEYVKTPPDTTYHLYEIGEIFIEDIGDGGCKSDKFQRDISLLTRALETTDPDDQRYHFYLANSYYESGDFQKAIEIYRRRIELGGWIEEIWYSYYRIGHSYMSLGNESAAITAWLDGYQVYPDRMENIYELVKYYRISGRNNLSYEFYKMANDVRRRIISRDFLFCQKNVYDYLLDYEFTILSFYCNRDEYPICPVCVKVLNHPHLEQIFAENIWSNYKFYSPQLISYSPNSPNSPESPKYEELYHIGDDIPSSELPERFSRDFVRSTPSIVYIQGDSNHSEPILFVVQRFVNYRIGDHGEYINQEKIHTVNILATFEKTISEIPGESPEHSPIQTISWRKTSECVMPYNQSLDDLYVGLEDVRVLYRPQSGGGRLFFNANRGLEADGRRMMVEHGEILYPYHVKSTLLSMSSSPMKSVEKNWVLFEGGERGDQQMKCIYQWYPLEIGDILISPELSGDSGDNNFMGDQLKITHRIKSPEIFKYLRGSTNGVLVGDNEIWFICHAVSYDSGRRYYYHMFVVLDKKTYRIIRYTIPFTFEKSPVEYTLGFVYNASEDNFLIGYSVMDREVKYMEIGRLSILQKLSYTPFR